MARGPNDNEVQSFTEDKVEEILPIYKKLNDEILIIVSYEISKGLSLKRNKEVQNEINTLVNSVALDTKNILDEIIPESYTFGLVQTNDQVPSLSRRIPVGPIHDRQLLVMLDQAYLDFGTGLQGAKKNAGQILNNALSDQIRNTVFSGAARGEALKPLSPELFANSVAGQTLKKIKEQGFTGFIDTAGRPWSLERYSEMLTRTHVIRAANEATVLRALELGVTILEMSSHAGTKDEACLEVEGKLFDLTGKRYPTPPSMPIHPNCRHKLFLRPDLE